MMNIPRRKELSLIALEGLTVGDCFGEAFFASQDPENDVHNRALPSHRWQYTDDTEMALSTVTVLHELGRISQDDLARSFARHYDPSRGYGPAMHRTLEGIRDGIPWMQLARAAFAGQGSHGNGAAMRVPPLGAYFFDEPQLLIQQAILSAEITHSHPEGIAGAVAVAVAAARATQSRVDQIPCGPYEFIDYVAFHTPASEVRSKILRGRSFLDPAKIDTAIHSLGNGIGLSAQDTVPFAIWCASVHLGNYREAMWATAKAGGDRDTMAAIVGGVVACATGVEGFPPEMLSRREPYPEWFRMVAEHGQLSSSTIQGATGS